MESPKSLVAPGAPVPSWTGARRPDRSLAPCAGRSSEPLLFHNMVGADHVAEPSRGEASRLRSGRLAVNFVLPFQFPQLRSHGDVPETGHVALANDIDPSLPATPSGPLRGWPVEAGSAGPTVALPRVLARARARESAQQRDRARSRGRERAGNGAERCLLRGVSRRLPQSKAPSSEDSAPNARNPALNNPPTREFVPDRRSGIAEILCSDRRLPSAFIA